MENNIIDPHNELAAPAKRNLPRDVFLHLLAMVTLYWSAISFITLCHESLNHFFPNALDYHYVGFAGPMQFAMASLMIVFPVFLLVSWFLNSIYKKEGEVRESKIRKWLIYLTLFVAALVIIGDLVFVINTFLGGAELTTRFLLKAFSIILVAGVIFWYYLNDVRRNMPSKLGKYLAAVSALIIVASIVGAFFIVGSPKQARLEQFDQQRVNDLQNIQWQVVNYWQRKGALPKSLTNLNDSISGYVAPTDPETNQSYEYNVKDITKLNFELCATFSLENKNNQRGVKPMMAYPGNYADQNWDHAAGHVCFQRTIDRQLYPPLNKGK